MTEIWKQLQYPKPSKQTLQSYSTLQTPGENNQQHLYLLSHDWDATIVPCIWQCYSEPICYKYSSTPLQFRGLPSNVNLIKLQWQPFVYVDYNNA